MNDAAPTIEPGRCGECEEWDGPFGWSDPDGRGWGKCCQWTINSTAANPGCGETHFRDTPQDGFCHHFRDRKEPDA